MRRKIKIQMKLPSIKMIVLIGMVVVAAGYLSGARPVSQEKDVGICAECHEDACTDFKLVRHAQIKMGKWTDIAHQVETICANCHGDPEEHLQAGGSADTIFTFKKTSLALAKAQKCLNCHSGTRSRFIASSHGKASMDCTNCHDELMKASLKRKSPTEICISCHEDVNAEFQLNERHKLHEGILGCTDCHNQHEPAPRERLAGFKQELCLKCHRDKGGPYLYEHDASRIEGCTACHEVHGSPNRHMLTHQSISDLCFSCHTSAPSWHSYFNSSTTNCTSCHSAIHGSNLHRLFLK